MMLRMLRGTAATLVLALSSGSLLAQDAPKSTVLMLGVGATIPIGDFSDKFAAAYHAQVGLRTRQLGQSAFAIRSDVMYGKGDVKDLPPGVTASWEITTVAVGLQVEARSGAAHPYAFGQWAYYNLKATASAFGQSFSESAEKGGISLGGGVRFALGSVKLYAEARYGYVSHGSNSSTKFAPLSVGVTF